MYACEGATDPVNSQATVPCATDALCQETCCVPMKCEPMPSMIGYVQCGETEVGKTCEVCCQAVAIFCKYEE